jgi:glycerophosphoryl diester phosphodiesterase
MRPDIVAHRGGGGRAPENTLAAFRRAVDDGVSDAVEFDVQRTRDGIPIVFHDADLRRTTDVESVYPERADSLVGDFTLAELRALDCGSWFCGGGFAGERIPTVSEVLDVVGGRIDIQLELKHPHRYPGIESAVAAILREHGLLDSSTLIVTSFELDSLVRFHDEAPQTALKAAVRAVADLETSGLVGVVASAGVSPRCTDDDRARLDGLGVPLSGGSAETPQRMREAIDSGLREIATHYPEMLDRVIHGLPPYCRTSPLVIEEVLLDDYDPTDRRAVIRNVSDTDVDGAAWHLWNGVATPLRPAGRIGAGERIEIRLTSPRGHDVSSMQALALHDDEHTLADILEFWAVPPRS